VVGGDGRERTARALEALPEVAAYVCNDHLGFAIPWAQLGRARQYRPDFLVRLRDPGDGVPRTLVVAVAGNGPPGPVEERAAARELWVPAVNNHGGFGRWGFVEVRAGGDLRAAFRAGGE
jgi:type III restriction enzyme